MRRGGYVYYQGKRVNDWREPRGGSNRISVIRNESCLAKDLTVADNIFVLRPGFRKWLIQPRVLEAQLIPFIQETGVPIRADAYIDELTTFQRFVVELLKAVVAGSRLIVLENVDAFISDSELAKLQEILTHYAGKGIAFLYLSAHFEETLRFCHRTALMSTGHILKYFDLGDIQKSQLSLPCAEDYDRWVRARPEKGQLLVGGRPLSSGRDRAIAVVQERPTQTMLFPGMSYMDNLCFSMDHSFPHIWTDRGMRRSIREEYAPLLGAEVFDRRVDDLTDRQKYDLVFTRLLLQRPRVVFCIHPFKKAGVTIRSHIWELIDRLLKKDIAVVILALNLADSLALAHRLVRLRQGRIQETYSREDFAKLPYNTPWLYLYREKYPK